MGLAATQARFLAITSRKANCEFRSMELAQQKLSVSRELEEATIDYNNAINASTLIWDADGTGAYRYNLSYDLMMTPSAQNKYTPYLLSRRDGKIAVDNNYKNALTGIVLDNGGIVYNGQVYHRGDENYDDAKANAYQNFIENLRRENVIPSSVINGLTASGATNNYRYIENAGIGHEPSQRETANVMSINSVTSYIDNLVASVDKGLFSAGSPEAELAEALTFNFGYEDSSGRHFYIPAGYKDNLGSTAILNNGEYISEWNTLTLADLLNENITMSFVGSNFETNENDSSSNGTNRSRTGATNLTCSKGESRITTYLKNNILDKIKNVNLEHLIDPDYDLRNPSTGNSNWFDEIAGAGTYSSYATHATVIAANHDSTVEQDDLSVNPQLYLTVINYIDKLAKGMYNLLMPDEDESLTGIQASETNRTAFFQALKNTLDRLCDVENTTANLNRHYNINGEIVKENVNKSYEYNCWRRQKGSYVINLSNLTEAFLSDFINAMDNYEDGCVINRKASNSVYITDNPDYLYTLNVPDANEDSIWEAEFYSAIFNNICQNGWYENQMLGEKSYIDNALKNGQLFVMSMADDYNYYQTRYAQISGGHIVEETDEDAVAQAEREYTYLKNKLNYKEERIEVEMKSVDAELSTLNTEYETVKNLINKSIENNFKLFQS